jgi:3-isopropylmalate dehydratase small subunit
VEGQAAEALMRLVETRPETELTLDLQDLRLQAGHESFPVRMPEARRKVFLTGSWDTVGLLLEGRERIQAVAARLPYIAEFPYPPA